LGSVGSRTPLVYYRHKFQIFHWLRSLNSSLRLIV